MDVVLPFQNGDLISMTLYGDMIDIKKMEIDGGPLSNIRIADFNQDSYDDSGKLHVHSMKKNYGNHYDPNGVPFFIFIYIDVKVQK